MSDAISEAGNAVVRRNTKAVHGKGKFDVFEEQFLRRFQP